MGLSAKTLAKAINRGELRAATTTGRGDRRIWRQWLDAWMMSKAQPPKGKAQR